MIQKIKNFGLTLLITLGFIGVTQLAYPNISNAQLFSGARDAACSGTQLNATDGDCKGKGEENRINKLIAAAINILSVIVGIIAVIMIIINGLRFIVSNGDSNSVSNARRGILYAIIGLIFVALAQVIVQFVLNEAGGDGVVPKT